MPHTTKLKHQPWKTGLKIDYRVADTSRLVPPPHWVRRARSSVFGDYLLAGRYKPQPDAAQERCFFGRVSECLDKRIITESVIRDEMAQNHF
jgi:hypothetical protein